jgi:hypothetical protein
MVTFTAGVFTSALAEASNPAVAMNTEAKRIPVLANMTGSLALWVLSDLNRALQRSCSIRSCSIQRVDKLYLVETADLQAHCSAAQIVIAHQP